MGELAIFGVKAWWRKTFQHPFIPLRGFDKYPPGLYTTKSLLCSPFSFKCCFRRRPPSDCSTAFHTGWRGGRGPNQLRVRTMAHFEWLSTCSKICFFWVSTKRRSFFTLPNVRRNAEISRHLQLQLAIFECFQCFKVPSFTHITGYGTPRVARWG